MGEKEIPVVLLILTVNARSLKNSSFLVLHPSSGVNTVECHLNIRKVLL